jgi:hypothetical protein
VLQTAYVNYPPSRPKVYNSPYNNIPYFAYPSRLERTDSDKLVDTFNQTRYASN